jgi:diacylglycerol kinase (ATP)
MNENGSKQPFSWKARGRSFKFAICGLRDMFASQHNARIHLAAAFLVIIVGLLLDISKTEWLLVFFAMGLVLCAETFNTAVECLVDLVSPEKNKKAKRIKDTAAGAVLIAAITAAAIGLFIFLPKIAIKF